MLGSLIIKPIDGHDKMQDIDYQSPWFVYLDAAGQRLAKTAFTLYFREKNHKTQGLQDYAFIVFSLSKAYEGFLKKFLFDLGLINKRAVEGKYFRIGRALNPDIRKYQRDEYWLYDDVRNVCGEEVSRELWNTWLKCRNQIFHYFPSKDKAISLDEAENRLDLLVDSMSKAVKCLESQ